MDDSLQPLFSIVVPTQGGPQLAKCIEAARSLRKHFDLELVIIADSEQQLVSHKIHFHQDKFIIFATCQGGGVSAARNRGLELARGRFFILTDDDCIVDDINLLKEVEKRSTAQSNSLHGGTYLLLSPSTYWAKVYNWINYQWLKMGQNTEGHQVHLLGGFMFGHSNIKSHTRFEPLMLWGGEEKEMLLRLLPLGIPGILHLDLAISHFDNSGIRKFIKRASYQGYAAGRRKLQSQNKITDAIPFRLYFGLGIFYCCSRLSISFGKLVEYRNRKQVTAAQNSPAA